MRKLCRKFHVEGDQIIKTHNGEPIPDDEPVFIIRGRDKLAVTTLLLYKAISEADGCNDWHFDLLNEEIKDFKKFREEHPERMKQPSITMGR